MTDQFTDALEQVSRQRGVRGTLLVSIADGLVVSEVAMEGLDTRAAAALAGALVQRLARAAAAAGRSRPTFLHMRAAEGALLAVPTEGDLLVVAIADPQVNVGLVKLALRDAAERVT